MKLKRSREKIETVLECEAATLDSFLPSDSQPTTHELESRASAAGWEKIRRELMTVVTENAAMPIGQVCINCESLASLRCQDCGPLRFFCTRCVLSSLTQP